MLHYHRMVVIFWLAVVLPGAAAAAENICFDCHDKGSFSGNIVHQPLADGQCKACHNPHVAHFKGLLEKEGADLCYACHGKEKEKFKEGLVHQPVRGGKCLACHEPHASANSGLLKSNLDKICFSCHDKLPQKYGHTHSPFAKGQCFACHRPHQAAYGQLLKDEPDKICQSCHKPQDLQQGHADYPGQLRNCLSCHNPHGSERKGIVRNVLHAPYAKGCKDCHDQKGTQGNTQSCLRCHEKVATEMHARHSHLTGKGGNKCVDCHSPHAADEKNLLKGSQVEVCRACHRDTMARYADKLYKHPEAKAGTCTSCHEVHGSNRVAMLRGDGNAICTQCHETQGKFTHPVGEKILDARTGQMVTCISCHLPMGSDFKNELIYSGSKDLCVQCHKRY
ncbi:MAG: hypothetical protein HY885_05785 [Deltaproteobacteria bacterium]|nr:hypothetical protein [Deltaproteobacteria bacterium]